LLFSSCFFPLAYFFWLLSSAAQLPRILTSLVMFCATSVGVWPPKGWGC
jgi:hypothetical protein